MVKYILYKIGQFLVQCLPIKAAYRFAVFISDMQYQFSPRDRRAVTSNLKIILPFKENVRQEAREVFRNFGRYLLEFFRMDKYLDKEFIKQHIKIENIHYVDQVLAGKKGGILLTAHVGNWELGGVVMGMLGYPIVAVALPHKERPVNDLFNRQREMRGVKIVQTNGAIRKCIEALRENKIVALLADRDFGMTGEPMDFLNRRTIIPKGPAVFSLKTGAPIIPGFLIRTQEDSFLLKFEEPIYPSQSGDEQKNLLFIMKAYAAVMERKIREYPSQWLMFREFWIK